MSPLPIGIDPAEPVEGESQTSGSGGMAFKADTINVSMVKSISFFIRFWIREYVGITRHWPGSERINFTSSTQVCTIRGMSSGGMFG